MQLWCTFLGFLTLTLATSFSVVLAAPRVLGYAVRESVSSPRGWTRQERAPAAHTIELRIGLTQPNFNALETHLYEVSDPAHARYGKHLSKEEVEELVAPRPESTELVTEWLASHGIPSHALTFSPAQDWITARAPIRTAEVMLNTTYHVWKHDDGDTIIRTTSYSLPEHLQGHVDVVQPTTMFSRFKSFKTSLHRPNPAEAAATTLANLKSAITAFSNNVTIDARCNATVTIQCLQQLYGTAGYKPAATKRNRIAVTGYLEEYANIKDLRAFYAEQRQDAINSTFKFISVKEGLNSQNLSQAGEEANLDVQFAFGLSFPTPATFYSTAGRPPFHPDLDVPTNSNEPYLDWLSYVLSHSDPPQTISTSYGDEEQTVPESYARRVCQDLAQLGARGVSLLFSSGDGGVGDGNPDPATQTCKTNDGRNATRFLPVFPASCPYVTAVGGTRGVPEVVAAFSGSGFSNYFSRPAYQHAAVARYLDTLPSGTYAGLFNRPGRAYPDISALALNFRIIHRGAPALIGGTSAAAPAAAGVIALLNDARLAAGRPALGFLNPLLYANPGAFNDILAGRNPGCGTAGFSAGAGWDAVTGLGTPDFVKLKAVVLKHAKSTSSS